MRKNCTSALYDATTDFGVFLQKMLDDAREEYCDYPLKPDLRNKKIVWEKRWSYHKVRLLENIKKNYEDIVYSVNEVEGLE